MLKQTITYTNEFTKEEKTEDHYFHLYKAHLVEMSMESLRETEITDPESGETLDGFRAKLQRIINSKDGVAILQEVKDLIRRSYGIRDGDDFLQSADISEKFMATEAYSQLLYDLCTNAEKQGAFINGIMPHDLAQETARLAQESLEISTLEEALAKSTPTLEEGLSDERKAELFAATPENPVEITRTEVLAMDDGQLQRGLTDGRYKLKIA